MSEGFAIIFCMEMTITFASVLSKHFVFVSYSIFIEYLLVSIYSRHYCRYCKYPNKALSFIDFPLYWGRETTGIEKNE